MRQKLLYELLFAHLVVQLLAQMPLRSNFVHAFNFGGAEEATVRLMGGSLRIREINLIFKILNSFGRQLVSENCFNGHDIVFVVVVVFLKRLVN